MFGFFKRSRAIPPAPVPAPVYHPPVAAPQPVAAPVAPVAPKAPVVAAPAAKTNGFDPLNREILRAELKRDEGVRLKVYRCTAGKLTIGTGRNLDDVGLLPAEIAKGLNLATIKRMGITMAQNDLLLDNDIDRTIADLDGRLPWWRKLDPVRQRVMINMAFNLGIGGLAKFRNTLSYIQHGQYGDAADNMLASLWARQVGARAKRLAELMRLGPKTS